MNHTRRTCAMVQCPFPDDGLKVHSSVSVDMGKCGAFRSRFPPLVLEMISQLSINTRERKMNK